MKTIRTEVKYINVLSKYILEYIYRYPTLKVLDKKVILSLNLQIFMNYTTDNKTIHV
jgi:hypothetical protein